MANRGRPRFPVAIATAAQGALLAALRSAIHRHGRNRLFRRCAPSFAPSTGAVKSLRRWPKWPESGGGAMGKAPHACAVESMKGARHG
jgi:hypothetical protein